MAVYEMSCSSNSDGSGGSGGDAQRAMREMCGPCGVDQQIRQAISTCWMMLPNEKKNPEAVAAEVRRIVERALANLKEDAAAFGYSTGGSATEG